MLEHHCILVPGALLRTGRLREGGIQLLLTIQLSVGATAVLEYLAIIGTGGYDVLL